MSVRLSETFNLSGYVVTEETLRQINEAGNSATSGSQTTPKNNFSIKFESGLHAHFASLDEALAKISTERLAIKEFSLSFERRPDVSVNANFKHGGTIEVVAFDKGADFQFDFERIKQEVLATDQDYPWIVRTFVTNHVVRRAVVVMCVLLSLILLGQVSYYAYATHIGVDIKDSSLIPQGMAYFQQVANAIQSQDTNEKLNILLKGQLRGFTNVSEVFDSVKKGIKADAVFLAVFFVIYLLLKKMDVLYPKSFFAIGAKKASFEKLVKRRDMWVVGIVVAGIVNLISGIVISLLI